MVTEPSSNGWRLGDTAERPRGSKLHHRLVESLGRSIVTGEFPPGSTFVPEQLCAEFGVSMSVVRESFRGLQAKGILAARSKVGTKVTDPLEWNYLDPQIIQWRIESAYRDEQVVDFFELRLAIEPVAAQLMADRGAVGGVANLQRSAMTMRESMKRGDLRAFVAADVDFHATLVAESGNRMFSTLRGVVELAVHVRETLFFPFGDASKHGLDIHEQLIEDITMGSPTAWSTARNMLLAARKEMVAHLGVERVPAGGPFSNQ